MYHLTKTRLDLSKRIATIDVDVLETQKMVNNIMCDVETSSTPLKRVREDGTLTDEANEVEFVVHNGNINTPLPKSNSAMAFFRLDPSYAQKLYDKANKMLPLSQNRNDSGSISKNLSKKQVCITLHYLVGVNLGISVYPKMNVHSGNFPKRPP